MDDILKYFEFSLNEGLIKTYSLETAKEYIEYQYLVDVLTPTDIPLYDITINNDKIYIILNNEQDNYTTDIVKGLVSKIYSCGYFISCFIVDTKNIKNKKLLTIEEITDNWYKKLIQIKIICEPKFQISVNIPDKLYHVSDIKFKEKIFKIGLIPKSLGKNSNHPDRIYCSNSLKDCYKLINTFKLKNIKRTDGTKYCIFEIDSQNLTTSNYKNEVEKVQFFEDINFKEYGVFTYCNIHPKYLQIVDDNI